MRALSRLLSVFLILAVLLGGGLLGGSAPARADFQAFEAGLNPDGVAWEINPDSEGSLWISDYFAGEIWKVNPLTAQYQVYSTGGSPADARRDGDFFYWVDGNKIVRSDLTGEYLSWTVSSNANLYSTAIDSLGRLWAIDFLDPHLYRLDPNPGALNTTQFEVCQYTMPENFWISGYLIWSGYEGKEYLWFGNDLTGRVYRFNITDNRLDWWQDPLTIGSIQGLAVDAQNDLWLANLYQLKGKLIELDPESNSMNQYALPNDSVPAMITVQGELLWFTVQDLPRLGILDPFTAESTSTDLIANHEYQQPAPDPKCDTISPEGPLDMTVSSPANFDPTGKLYPTFHETGGWYMYLMPQGADPWGITLVDDTVWVVDHGRQMLAQTWLQASLRACKKWDFDKNAGTIGDQHPVPGWRMDLYEDNSLVDSKLTGADGCAQWDGLELPATYKVGEETRPDWELIDWPGCDPTEITLPGTHTCTFVNWTEVHPVFLPLIQR